MKKYFALIVFLLPVIMSEAKTEKLDPENTLTIELKDGEVIIELFAKDAPNHVERIKTLAKAGKYDGRGVSSSHRGVYGPDWRC